MAAGKDILFVIPAPGFGHLGSIVEMANLILTRARGLTVNVLVIKPPFGKEEELVKKLSVSHSDMNFVDIPLSDVAPDYVSGPPGQFLISYIDSHKRNVSDAVKNLVSKNDRILFMVDFFCNSMIEVARDQFKAPCYAYVISGAGFVGLSHFITTRSHVAENETEWHVPSFDTPVPTPVLPLFAQSDVEYATFSNNFSYFEQMNGIIVNTFYEFEPFALESFLHIRGFPTVYPVGPLLEVNHASETNATARARILSWLDAQENESVLFLCFGREGCFKTEQVNEIALGLERSGVKFLWALRKPVAPGVSTLVTDVDVPSEILPQGFLDRTAGRGMVCGWAPQQEILNHPAVGGFVTHCGMNSVHESIRFGVPMATWPLYAEQQLNAFALVKDLKVAVEITMDYRIHQKELVLADKIQNAVEWLMDVEGRSKDMRKRVKELSKISKKVADEGGSSFEARNRLVSDMLGGFP